MKKRTIGLIIGIPGFFIVLVIALIIGLAIRSTNSGSSLEQDVALYKAVVDSEVASSMAFDEGAAEVRTSAVPYEPTAGETAADTDARIIKTGYLDIIVDDVATSAEKITAIADQVGGFVQSSSVSEYPDGTKYGTVIIRVPVARFDDAMENARTEATLIENETTSGQDVTEQYTDLQAQLRNAKAQEEAYLAVLDRATSVEDILNVQEALGSIRATIESLEGRIQYLENATDYSTITVSMREETSVSLPTEEFRPLASIKEAAQALVVVGQTLVIGLIWVVIVGGGILIPIGGVIWLIVYLVRRARRSKTKK